MKKIAIYNPSISSMNMGDVIIKDSAEREIKGILQDNFIVNYATHTPPRHIYQGLKRVWGGIEVEYDYSFVYGTNLMRDNMFSRANNWNINLLNCRHIKDAVLVGVGSASTSNKPNFYTKALWNKVLSKKYIHSTRDNFTKELLESMGFKAINTGCVTLWGLTPEICAQIPKSKAEQVVFTLTDYSQDKIQDQKLIDILKKNYKKVYFWVQGFSDLEYFNTLTNTEEIEIISPAIENFNNVLDQDIDYIGTRLHGGVFSMQNKKRAIIITVDNRAREIHKDFRLTCIERKNMDKLEELLNSEITTKIKLDFNKIEQWKSQFN